MISEVSTVIQSWNSSTVVPVQENSSERFGQDFLHEVATDSQTSDPSDDAVWILTSTFIIFTMQSGFGLLESGSVTPKNEVNIMMKNAIDVLIGGFTYWMFGYGFSFGQHRWTNPFSGWGSFFVEVDPEKFGEIYSKFFFQASFATTATTIVSGAMAERTKLEAYIVFSFVNTLVFCFPAHWVWAPGGWLKVLGMVDVAGDGPVHLVGGVTGLVATILLKPRHGRYDCALPPAMGSPTNAILGMFMLWWGWLGFNCGSTFGISGQKWKLAARSAVATLCSSVGGGSLSLLLSYVLKKRKFDVAYMINGILGSLVAITGLCALAQPWEGLVIGAIGAILSLLAIEGLDKLHIDDPVGCVGVHAVGGAWGLLAVGLFARQDQLRSAIGLHREDYGLIWGGGWYLIGVQTLAIVVIASWSAVLSYTVLKLIDVTVGLRMPLQSEILGADLVEHSVGDIEFDKVKQKIVGLRDNQGTSYPIDNNEAKLMFTGTGVQGRQAATGSTTENGQVVDGKSPEVIHSGICGTMCPNGTMSSGGRDVDAVSGSDIEKATEFVKQKEPHSGPRYKTKWKQAIQTILSEDKERSRKTMPNLPFISQNRNDIGKGSLRNGGTFIRSDAKEEEALKATGNHRCYKTLGSSSVDYDNSVFSWSDEESNSMELGSVCVSSGQVSEDASSNVLTSTRWFMDVPRGERTSVISEAITEDSISVYL